MNKLEKAERAIAEALESSGTSDWLKNALRSALNRDVIDAKYDAKRLAKLVADFAEALQR